MKENRDMVKIIHTRRYEPHFVPVVVVKGRSNNLTRCIDNRFKSFDESIQFECTIDTKQHTKQSAQDSHDEAVEGKYREYLHIGHPYRF